MSVSLVKGQKVSLSKNGSSLSHIFVGLGWDMAKKAAAIDLDASCLVFGESGNLVDQIWFGQLSGMAGAITHTGDNLTGEGDGDDEVIKVDLSKISSNVNTLIFTVSSFRGQTFDKIANASCRVVDSVSNNELVTFSLSEMGSHAGLIMAKIYRHKEEWKVHAIGEKTMGRTFRDMIPTIQKIGCLKELD